MSLVAILQALVARFLFFVHSSISIWRCVDVLGNSWLWLIGLANVALIVETFITCFKRRGREWKWFSPSIFLFLCATIPSIWFLELDRLDKFGSAKDGSNATQVAEALSEIQGITIPIQLPANLWVNVIEQLLLLFLILGRWIMPMGGISRDALSQLLFVYIGMSSDIMELFVLFEEEELVGNIALSYTILSVWTLSLLQFSFVLTATKNPKRTRISFIERQPEARNKMGAPRMGCCQKWFATEAWSICASLFMQDGPFLCVRMFTMIKYNVITYNTIFFTCKNILVVMILIYRMCIVCSRDPDITDGDKTKVKINASQCKCDQEKNSARSNGKPGLPPTSNGTVIVPMEDKPSIGSAIVPMKPTNNGSVALPLHRSTANSTVPFIKKNPLFFSQKTMKNCAFVLTQDGYHRPMRLNGKSLSLPLNCDRLMVEQNGRTVSLLERTVSVPQTMSAKLKYGRRKPTVPCL